VLHQYLAQWSHQVS